MDEPVQLTGAPEVKALRALHRWLGYERLAVLLGGAAYVLPFGLVAGVLVVLAVVFTPYMLWKLHRAAWHTAIGLFALLVLVPVATGAGVEGVVLSYFLHGGALIAFYLYTWVLHHMIGEHLREVDAVRALRRG